MRAVYLLAMEGTWGSPIARRTGQKEGPRRGSVVDLVANPLSSADALDYSLSVDTCPEEAFIEKAVGLFQNMMFSLNFDRAADDAVCEFLHDRQPPVLSRNESQPAVWWLKDWCKSAHAEEPGEGGSPRHFADCHAGRLGAGVALSKQ